MWERQRRARSFSTQSWAIGMGSPLAAEIFRVGAVWWVLWMTTHCESMSSRFSISSMSDSTILMFPLQYLLIFHCSIEVAHLTAHDLHTSTMPGRWSKADCDDEARSWCKAGLKSWAVHNLWDLTSPCPYSLWTPGGPSADSTVQQRWAMAGTMKFIR